VQTGLLARRARFLPLLAHAIVAFREREMSGARALVIVAGAIHDRCGLANVAEIAGVKCDAVARPRTPHDRKTCFDAAVYDHMRILLTELQRVRGEGGDVALRIGHHIFAGERVARLMRGI